MFNSLRARLWLTYALVTAVVLSLVAAAIVFYLLRNPIEVRQANLRLSAAAEVLSQRGRLPLERQDDLQVQVARAAELLDVRVLVVRPDGGIIADSHLNDSTQLTFESPPQDPSQANLLPQNLVDEQGRRWLFTLRPLPGSANLYLFVATPRPRPTLRGIVSDELFRPLFQAGAIALALSLLFSILISRWVAAPLQRMAGSARAMAEGQFQPVKPEGPNEVQALGRSFNEMSRKVVATQQSQRDFVANVSHELKTPLTSIQGFAQAILDGTVSTPEALRRAAGVIHDEAGRMHRLVLDLLDLARLDAGTAALERGEVDLGSLLRAVADKFAPQSQSAKVTLQAYLPPLPPMMGDGDRLAQVFTNLMDNAIKHTPPGGLVSLTAGQQNGRVAVIVADSGPGIPPEELPRIFERFYQVDKARQGGAGRGVGLGLAIAREIVQAHGGSMEARSEAGQGAAFVVTLPVALPDDSTVVAKKKNV
ncbi:MAG: HAMP domain-containing histidine kinase [Anaerolineae bacterium]|nr:MAG: HAMP domain-containing histidine kinase [Anaerolineae bacterium]